MAAPALCSLFFTWSLFTAVWAFEYEESTQFSLAVFFLSVFFVTFYISFLVYKIRKGKGLEAMDIVLILLNAFIFYGLGYALLANHSTYQWLLGLFTLGNAIIHFAVAWLIFKRNLANKAYFIWPWA